MRWWEEMEPYFDGVITSEKIMAQNENYRVVRRGYRRAKNGKPYGNVVRIFELEYPVDHGFGTEWELDCVYPTLEEAKANM